MRQSYMDYAMSVIIQRALPDARDGLKPVHRRSLYAMYDLSNDWNRPYKKSARIVGDVIGKYHPHGDQAVYDTIVRMVQDFSLRYPLVDGQGNFGSIDGDPPAAMRYTEVRMARIASELLGDIDKETVDFTPNYDDTLREPVVLPARIPNLLVNGSSGIAVGMATNIPPHNLGEVVDGLVALIDDPSLTVDQLMQYIPGPDFPTAGFIHGRSAIREAYHTGRGVLQMRARVHIEEGDERRDKTKIIVSELPYQVNKARLIERIAEMVNDKRIEGISDLRDESDRDGMRVVIDLKRDAVPEVVLNQLYKMSALQESFGINMLAIVGGRPRTLDLREALQVFIDHRKEVVTRRTAFELRKAQERLHILEGLKIAIESLDAVIALIRAAADPATARDGLMSQFSLSEIQAQAILDMRLQRLTNLERDRIIEEHAEVLKQIARYREILAEEGEVLKIIVEELHEVRKLYADARRTEIVEDSTDLTDEDLIAEEDMVVTVSHDGYIKRNPVGEYRAQRRGGRGKIGAVTKEEDFIEHLFVASTHAYILFFTTSGKLYWIKVYALPQAGRAARGKAIVNLLQLQADEKVSAFLTVREFHPGLIRTVRHQAGRGEEDGPSRIREPAPVGDHRHQAERRRRGHRRTAYGRRSERDPLHPHRPGDPLPGGRCPSHGPRRRRGTGHLAREGRRGGRGRRRESGSDPAHRRGEGLRQADGDGRVPRDVARRQGDPHLACHRPQRAGRGRAPGPGGRRHHADHRRRQGDSHAGARHLGHGAKHPGRSPHRSGRRREGRRRRLCRGGRRRRRGQRQGRERASGRMTAAAAIDTTPRRD